MRLINWPASSIIWSKLDRLMMKPSLPNSKLVTKNVACRGYKLKHHKWVTPLCRRMPRRTPDTQFLKRGVPFGCFATFQVHCVFTNPTVCLPRSGGLNLTLSSEVEAGIYHGTPR